MSRVYIHETNLIRNNYFKSEYYSDINSVSLNNNLNIFSNVNYFFLSFSLNALIISLSTVFIYQFQFPLENKISTENRYPISNNLPTPPLPYRINFEKCLIRVMVEIVDCLIWWEWRSNFIKNENLFTRRPTTVHTKQLCNSIIVQSPHDSTYMHKQYDR